MSNSTDPHDPTFGPFSFEGWDDQGHILNPPLSFAEERAAWCERLADEEEVFGGSEGAEKYRTAATWWRNLSNLPSGVNEPIDR